MLFSFLFFSFSSVFFFAAFLLVNTLTYKMDSFFPFSCFSFLLTFFYLFIALSPALIFCKESFLNFLLSSFFLCLLLLLPFFRFTTFCLFLFFLLSCFGWHFKKMFFFYCLPNFFFSIQRLLSFLCYLSVISAFLNHIFLLLFFFCTFLVSSFRRLLWHVSLYKTIVFPWYSTILLNGYASLATHPATVLSLYFI